jgi:hypothetical protein
MKCPWCGKDTEAIGTKDVSNEPWFVWFDAFWSLYPRKVAKASALKAWKKAATSEAVKDAIMAGLERQLPALRPKDRQFVPHAATWLNQERWNDEPEGGLRPGGQPRVIECNKCGDTGVVYNWTVIPGIVGPPEATTERCSCSQGQVPDLMVGRFNLETGECVGDIEPSESVGRVV